MINRTIGRYICAVIAVMFVCLAGSSFAADKSKAQALSSAIAQVKMFSKLADDELDDLKSIATLRQGKADERIIQQGKPMDRMFIIMGSDANVIINGKLFVTLSDQPMVGEVEFLDKRPASADVVLVKDSSLIELKYDALTKLMEKRPRLGYLLMRKIAKIEAQRLRQATE